MGTKQKRIQGVCFPCRNYGIASSGSDLSSRLALFFSAIGTSFLFGWYPVFLLMNKMKEKKRQFLLHFYYEERVYMAGKIRRYEKSEFIQKEDIKETDTI